MSDANATPHYEQILALVRERNEAEAERDALRAELAALKGQKPVARSGEQPYIQAAVADIEAACLEYVEAFRAARGPLKVGALSRCLVAEQSLIKIVGAKPDSAPAPIAQPIPPTVTLGMVETLERTADLIDETRKRLDAVGTRLEQYQTEIAPTAQPVDKSPDTHNRPVDKAAEMPTAQPVQPTLSKRMAAAGFTPRDRRLTCDECGAKFTAQMAPLHECEAPRRPCPLPEHLASLPVCPWCDKQQWDVCQHAEEAKVCGGHR